ncbi:MAG TPA: UDP-N-acetylmuramoyl-tripeptide--D-alanyl-D-alanine ligase [Steroidobacteraceae bacterium]|jgi:UDP-N-acetylmuramoyl-tripeptide--D-alanyl-D-alanine ligase|nr:UDP-N-acetylmuramoyl-tripeptide--D-alanyl-D-alanine ligase [Steroidobacteraceae bacterium]
MELSLAQVQAATHARMAHPSERVVRGWSIDSRTIAPGDLFFAIKGDRFDGHAFITDVLARGAAAAVVSESPATVSGTLLEVEDTLVALQQLAGWARRRWGKPVVAVTGSAGKTSTKDIIAELLSVRLCAGKTIGNLNNHIGLPLALLRIPDAAEVAVLELGMNHAGEIRHLASIAEPQIGVVTNVGYAHVEAFDSIEGVAAAKRELIESLPPSGIAVLNADDPRVLSFRAAHPGRTVTYGIATSGDLRGGAELDLSPDLRATELELSPEGAEFRVCGVKFQTTLSGRHAVSNILAGLAVAKLFDIEPGELVESVARLAPGEMRGERGRWREITILNDSYNSNPEAARNMIDVLRQEPAERRIAVLGEMLELGRLAESLHRDLGNYVANAGVDVLVGVSGVSRFMVEEASRAGMTHAAFFFENPEQAGQFLREFVRTGDAILFKGSRGVHVERTLAAMKA